MKLQNNYFQVILVLFSDKIILQTVSITNGRLVLHAWTL